MTVIQTSSGGVVSVSESLHYPNTHVYLEASDKIDVVGVRLTKADAAILGRKLADIPLSVPSG